jgi:CBS domain-containing protein
MEEVKTSEWDLLAEHTVAEAMSRRVCVIPSGADVASAAAYMLKAGIHRLLVKDDGRFVGMVTTTDVLRAVVSARRSGRPLW